MKAYYIILRSLVLILVLQGCSGKSPINANSDNEKIETILVEITIEGMSCMSCVVNVKKTLTELDGVTDVTVSLQKKKAYLYYNPQKISLQIIREAINDLGYNAGEPHLSQK